MGPSHSQPAIVLAVGSDPRNLALLGSFLEREGYRLRAATGSEELDRELAAPSLPAVALVDLTRLDGAVWGVCDRLSAQKVPVIIVSPVQSAAIRQQSQLHGARAVLTRPVVVKHLLALMSSLVGE